MTDQLEHLHSLVRQNTADIRVWTSQMGVHPWMSGAFTEHAFTESELDVVYLENLVEGKYFETASTIERFKQVFASIRDPAVPFKEYA